MIQQNPRIIKALLCILNILRVIDLSLVLFNTSCGIYTVLKGSKCAAVFV